MQRRVEMTYYSAPSGRTKSYSFDPMRLTAADGGMYITGWVQEYEQMRTFAAERIRKLAVTDQIFEMRTLPPEPFGNSIGAFSGRPELMDIEFDRNVADFVASREWHARRKSTCATTGRCCCGCACRTTGRCERGSSDSAAAPACSRPHASRGRSKTSSTSRATATRRDCRSIAWSRSGAEAS